MEKFVNWLNDFLAGTGLNLLTAIVVLVIGLFIIKLVGRISKNSLEKTSMERTTVSFVVSIVNFALYAVLFYFVLVTAFPNLGAGIIAILGSAALAVGLALKDSLSDFASGIMIIFNKPFKEGDFISVDGVEGTIKAIHLLHTVIYTVDNKKVVINNSRVNSNKVINFSARPTRRVDLNFTVAYGSDLDAVKKAIFAVVDQHTKVLKTPEPLIRLGEYGQSGLVFRCRVWVNNADYWQVYFDLNERVYEKFNETGIVIPFETVTVHIADKEVKDEK